jgi:hypothetical protein
MQLATRNSQLATRNSQLATRNSQLAIRNSQLATRNSQLAIRNSQLATRILDNRAAVWAAAGCGISENLLKSYVWVNWRQFQEVKVNLYFKFVTLVYYFFHLF